MGKGQNKQLEKFLSEVDYHLKFMSVTEKTDILSELKSSFFERIKNGQSQESIIVEWGTLKEFAMSYMSESIIKKKGFYLKRFIEAMGFYSIVSMSWISIIPTLAVLSVSFFFASTVRVLAGVMGLLKGIIHIALIDKLKIIFFIYQLKGILALLVGIALAIIFIGLGVICWKGTIYIIKLLQVQGWKLKYEED